MRDEVCTLNYRVVRVESFKSRTSERVREQPEEPFGSVAW